MKLTAILLMALGFIISVAAFGMSGAASGSGTLNFGLLVEKAMWLQFGIGLLVLGGIFAATNRIARLLEKSAGETREALRQAVTDAAGGTNT